jgi:hypothetical protein
MRWFGDPSAVDQDVQPPERVDTLFDQRRGDTLVVGGPDHRGRSPSRRSDSRDGLVYGSGVASVDHYAGAQATEQLGDGATDAAAAAGHHRTTPCQEVLAH